MKPFYGVPKVGNHWFTTDHIYHKKELKMTKSTYDLCLLYRFDLLGIMEI